MTPARKIYAVYVFLNPHFARKETNSCGEKSPVLSIHLHKALRAAETCAWTKTQSQLEVKELHSPEEGLNIQTKTEETRFTQERPKQIWS